MYVLLELAPCYILSLNTDHSRTWSNVITQHYQFHLYFPAWLTACIYWQYCFTYLSTFAVGIGAIASEPIHLCIAQCALNCMTSVSTQQRWLGIKTMLNRAAHCWMGPDQHSTSCTEFECSEQKISRQ